MVERISRPWLSVPRMKKLPDIDVDIGGVKPSIRLSVAGLNGLYGAISGAKIAASTMRVATRAATMVTGERRNENQMSLSKKRATAPLGATAAGFVSALITRPSLQS